MLFAPSRMLHNSSLLTWFVSLRISHKSSQAQHQSCFKG
jgi:hypothetical protein